LFQVQKPTAVLIHSHNKNFSLKQVQSVVTAEKFSGLNVNFTGDFFPLPWDQQLSNLPSFL
jgi:hypothetical protein